MPVRSLSSSVIKWPDPQIVKKALKDWTKQIIKIRSNVLKIGYFGSYAKGNSGVGSDLDVIMIIKDSDKSFLMRAAEWDLLDLPVPTDLLVYTMEEWKKLPAQGRLGRTLIKDVKWIYDSELL